MDELLTAGRLHSTAVVMFHTAVADHAGLTVTESKAMEIIQRLGPLTPRELARESGLAPASVTALVDRLTTKKVARRTPHPTDQRRVLVEIDPGYAQRNDTLFTAFVTSIRQLCQQYEVDQIRLISQFLTAAAHLQEDATSGLVAGS
ncbi:MarR family winged helix-turn-helix transcriptional regulator [uncultured Jatrophihabitans sp.]|uniref:MarR family winged helix-turn-helix transcriptional regulator n=1 Tax=uncultured Jatrophihabitans sp. TaxID=1610747 RepID=UPI0035CAC71B